MQDAEEIERCITDDDGDDEDDDDEDDNDEFVPDPSVWKPGLEDLIYSNDTISKMYHVSGLSASASASLCTKPRVDRTLADLPNQWNEKHEIAFKPPLLPGNK
ncbi:unnamed protein product [Penicillium crustosum]